MRAGAEGGVKAGGEGKRKEGGEGKGMAAGRDISGEGEGRTEQSVQRALTGSSCHTLWKGAHVRGW